MKKVKVADLVFDFTMYPRADVDSQHVHYMCAALRAGATLPPIVIDKATKRVADGFHRGRAYQKLGIEEIEVVEKSYRSDQELFLDCIRYNAGHGRTLTTFDRTHCLIRAEELNIEAEAVAEALCLTMDAVGELKASRIGKLRAAGPVGGQVPLKRTVSHMAGRTLTKGQVEANDKLSGMRQAFYVNQIITLIESGMLNREDESLMARLRTLHELLGAEIAATA